MGLVGRRQPALPVHPHQLRGERGIGITAWAMNLCLVATMPPLAARQRRYQQDVASGALQLESIELLSVRCHGASACQANPNYRERKSMSQEQTGIPWPVWALVTIAVAAIGAYSAKQVIRPDIEPSPTPTPMPSVRPEPTRPPIGPNPRPPSSPRSAPPVTGQSGFRVVEVFLRADPFDYSGPCPVKITFSGRISVVGGAGRVSYRFARSDGASAPVQTLTFDAPGSKDVSTIWTLGGAVLPNFSGWQAIEILEPQERRSGNATFKIRCE